MTYSHPAVSATRDFITLRCQAGHHDACGGHIVNPWRPIAYLSCNCDCHAWATKIDDLFPF